MGSSFGMMTLDGERRSDNRADGRTHAAQVPSKLPWNGVRAALGLAVQASGRSARRARAASRDLSIAYGAHGTQMQRLGKVSEPAGRFDGATGCGPRIPNAWRCR
jgi:hypothetical protein